MNWLARLKAQTGNSTHATNATPSQNVAFVAPISEANLLTTLHPAAHLPQPGLRTVQTTDKATNATKAPNVAFVASPPSAKPTAGEPTDPARWCWPHSSAMNTQEIDTFIVRLEQFTRKGVSLSEAEVLAERLVLRQCPARRHGGRHCQCAAAGWFDTAIAALPWLKAHPSGHPCPWLNPYPCAHPFLKGTQA